VSAAGIVEADDEDVDDDVDVDDVDVDVDVEDASIFRFLALGGSHCDPAAAAAKAA
jgi:hypothetical protein